MTKQTMKRKIYLNKYTLPISEQDALERIFNYFNGFDIDYTFDKHNYIITLTRSDFSFCEDISKGLNDICVSEKNINDFCYLSDNACLCLSENWIPYAWSIIAAPKLKTKHKFAIIHVDDHSDLMSPFIRYEAGLYYNMLNGNTIDFLNEKSISDAVMSGAITIGSMLTTIVYSVEAANIYHIKHSAIDEIKGIKKTTFTDSFIEKGQKRISISFEENETTKNRYILTSKWSTIAKLIGTEDECILHIDMDYFNNRYNGSTSWRTDGGSNDLSFEEQRKSMDILLSNVQHINTFMPIKYILVGVSPSFYPAEYWKIGLNYLLEGLKNIGLNVQGLIDRINLKGEGYGNM